MYQSLPELTQIVDSSTAILRRDNDEADLVERVRVLSEAVNNSRSGTQRHCANMRLGDALAALSSFRHQRDDPQGFTYSTTPRDEA